MGAIKSGAIWALKLKLGCDSSHRGLGGGRSSSESPEVFVPQLIFMASQNIFVSFEKFSPALEWEHQTPMRCSLRSRGALPKSPALSSIHGERQEGHPHLFLPLPQVLQEEGLDLGVQMEAIRPLIHGNPNHQQKMGQLSAHCQALQRSLEVRGQRRARAARPPGPAISPCRSLSPLFFLHSFQLFLPPFLTHSADDY